MLSKITSWRHSKVLAFVLAVAVFLTAFYGLTPVISLAEATDAPAPQAEPVVGTWDGTKTDVATAFAGQDGKGDSAENPYEITNGTQLYAAVNCAEEYYFKLMNDIVLQPEVTDAAKVAALTGADSTLKNWYVSSPKTFIGHLDGDFHTVSGLYSYSTGSGDKGMGFITKTGAGASVKNLTLDGAYVSSAHLTAALIGQHAAAGSLTIEGVTVKNSKIKNILSTFASNPYMNTATGLVALVTKTATITVSKCAVYNNVIDDIFDDAEKINQYVTSFLGDDWAGSTITVTDSIFQGYYPYNKTANVIYTRCYTDATVSTRGSAQHQTSDLPTKLETTQMKGSTAYEKMSDKTPGYGWIVKDADSMPAYVGIDNLSKYTYLPTKEYWGGVKQDLATAFADQVGKGTSEANPYKIYNANQLYATVTHTGTEEKWFVIMNDISLQSNAADVTKVAELNDTTLDPSLKKWDTKGKAFYGHIDGNFKTISGLYINDTDSASDSGIGFIGRLYPTASVKNLTIDGAYMTAKTPLGGIAGRAHNGAPVIDGCSVINSKLINTASGSLNGGETAVAGIAAISYLTTSGSTFTISNCAVYNTVLQNNDATRLGGIGGDYWGTKPNVSNCIVVGYPAHSRNNEQIRSFNNVFSDNANSKKAINGSTVTVLSQAQLKGSELPGFDASTGWEIKAGQYPKYVGSTEHTKNSTVYWNGYITTFDKAFAGQSGKGADANTPYEIYYGYQLYAAVAHTGGSYFKLMNDIQLQSDANMVEIKKAIDNDSTADLSTLNSWRYVGYTSAFKGHIDGNFKTVSGVYLNVASRSADTGLGFISTAKGGSSIKNLTLDSAYLTGNDNIGGFIGLAYQGSGGFDITGCVLKNSKFHSTSTEAGNQYATVAGYVGGYWSGEHIRIHNSIIYDTTLLSDNNSVAGFTANDITNFASNPHAITNCISVGYVPTLTSATVCTNVYTDVNCNVLGVIANTSVDTLKGGGLLGFNSTTGWDNTPGSYPKYVGYDKFEHPENTDLYWDGFKFFIDVDQLSGKGTVDEPYKIHYPFQLFGVLQNTNADLYFEIMNDFYLNKEDGTKLDWNLWEQNKVFSGHLNGNGHTVYNMEEIFAQGTDNSTANSKTGAIALIPAAQNATISNLHIRGTQMNDVWCSYTAGLVGVVKAGTVSINGCSVNDSNISSNDSTAAFVAKVDEGATVNVENCVTGTGTKLTKRGSGIASGIVALNNGTVNLNNCISAGYAFAAGEGNLVAGDNAFAIVSGGDYADAAALKAAIAEGTVTLSSEVFYYDALSNNLPMLKKRLATQDKDIDGDDDADLDADDTLALKNILLYGYTDYLTLSADKAANGYNDLPDVDITDLVALAKKKQLIKNPLFNCGTPTHTNALSWAKQYGTEMTWGEYYSVDSDLMVATVRPTALTGVYSLKHDAGKYINSGAHAYLDFANNKIGLKGYSGGADQVLTEADFTFVAGREYEIQHTVIGGHEIKMTVIDTVTKTATTVEYIGDNNAAYYSRSLGTHTSVYDDTVEVISEKLYSLQPYNAQALIMGDSFVAGFYRTRYGTLIKNDIGGSAFINGVSGGDTDHVQEMLTYLPDLCNPRYVVLAIGTNQNGYSRWSTDIEDILNTIKTAWPEAQIILGTVTLRTDKTEQNLPFVTQANDWIRNSGYKYVDIYQLTTNTDGDIHTQITSKFQSDGVHLTPAANIEVYNEFKTVVPELFE